ncbi:MAG TPA: hypothetical protein VJH37_03160 [Candidatus Nanoarchaeia archaeon]|nr:hypothetical protein [Candidatus Nanoarchaeia archaeon]
MIPKKTNFMKILALIFVFSLLLLSIGYARQKDLKEALTAFFDDSSLKTVEQYQEQYTPLEALQLKLQGKLPDARLQIRQEPLEEALPLEEKEQPLQQEPLAPSIFQKESALE